MVQSAFYERRLKSGNQKKKKKKEKKKKNKRQRQTLKNRQELSEKKQLFYCSWYNLPFTKEDYRFRNHKERKEKTKTNTKNTKKKVSGINLQYE